MVCIMGIIFYLSHQPGELIFLPPLIGLDKLLHIIAYGILAAAFLYSLQPYINDANRTSAAVVAVLFCILYGMSDEYHQLFIPGRFVSFWDVVADGLGALLVVFYWFLRSSRAPLE